MKWKLFALILGLVLGHQAKAFHLFGWWLNGRAIHAANRLCGQPPLAVDAYFKKHDKTMPLEQLGFGWTSRTANISGWDIEVTAVLYYYQDSIMAYSMEVFTSAQRGKRKRQQRKLQPAFELRNDTLLPFVANKAILEKPLSLYTDTFQKVDPALGPYMSPLSGTAYGYYSGGGTGNLMTNRQAFMAIQKRLSNSEIERLMYAINPATRFTAFEYYWAHKESFGERPDIDAWMERNVAAFPKLPYQVGCIIYEGDTKALIWEYGLRHALSQKQ